MVILLLDKARQACERALAVMNDHPLMHVTRFISRIQRTLVGLKGGLGQNKSDLTLEMTTRREDLRPPPQDSMGGEVSMFPFTCDCVLMPRARQWTLLSRGTGPPRIYGESSSPRTMRAS